MTESLSNAPTPDHREQLLRRCSQLAAWVITATGIAVLLGWMFDLPTLKSVVPGFATMKPNTALAFVLLGIAIAQLHRSRSARSRRMSQLIAIAAP